MDALALAINANRRHPRSLEPGRVVRRPVSSWAAQPWLAAILRRARAHPGLCIGAVPGAAAAAALACLLARRSFRSCGRSGVRRVAAPPCAATPPVQHCRASVPGDALQARPMPYPTKRNRQARRLSLPRYYVRPRTKRKPRRFETAALLVGSASASSPGS
jgi:hypothetical protein